MELYKDLKEVLFTKEQIAQKVKELGKQISLDYKGKQLLLICTLRGASVFFSDLIREIDADLTIDFIATSSYGAETTTSGEVKLTKDLSTPIEGKNVIIVEDIIDSGLTLKYVKRMLETRNPASLKICALLDKPEGRRTELKGDYIGFTIPKVFIVGYGLDYDEKYRQLPEIGVLDPKVYTK